MTDLSRMEEALKAAADAGDTQAATAIAAEIRKSLQRQNPSLGMPEPLQLGQGGMPNAIRAAVRSSSQPEQAYAGAGSALALASHGVNQAMGGAAGSVVNALDKGLGQPPAGITGPDTSAADIQNWRSLAGATPATIGGNIAGNAALFTALPARLGPGVGGLGLPILASRPGMVADTALTSGVLNAMATPGSPRERTGAGVLSAGTSLIAPAAYALGASGRRTLTREGKRLSVGEGLRQELGDEGTQRLQDSLLAPDPGMMLGVQSSSAMRSGVPTLEVLETGSRASRGDLWRDFDKGNAGARWAALTSRAGTPEELSVLKGARDSATSTMRSDALGKAANAISSGAEGEIHPAVLGPLNDLVDKWRTGALRPNRDVQALGDFLESELKQGVTPDQLYEIRKTLTEGVKAGRTDQLSSSIKQARAQRMEAVGMIDDALEQLSGGGWKDYLKNYADASPPITSKQALQDVVTSLKRGQPEGAVPVAMGESPAYQTVGNLRDRFGQKQFGSQIFDRLTPEDRDLLNTMVDNLKRQSDVMKAKGILGSHTAPLLAGAQRAGGITGALAEGAANAIPYGGILASSAFNRIGRQAEEELARLLQDPIALSAALDAAKRAQTVGGVFTKGGGASGGIMTGLRNR